MFNLHRDLLGFKFLNSLDQNFDTFLGLRIQDTLELSPLLAGYSSPRLEQETHCEEEKPTHEVNHKLLGFEVFLHLCPDTVQLQLPKPFKFFLGLFLVEHGLSNLLLRKFIPLKLLHLSSRCDRKILASTKQVVKIRTQEHRCTGRIGSTVGRSITASHTWRGWWRRSRRTWCTR